MEIDYEKSSNPNLSGLQKFVTAYRSVIPYDATGANQAARLHSVNEDGAKAMKSYLPQARVAPFGTFELETAVSPKSVLRK